MNRSPCNAERLGIYSKLFTRLIRGWGDDAETESVMVNLLVNTRWPEVSRAFVDCLGREGAAGAIRPLAQPTARRRPSGDHASEATASPMPTSQSSLSVDAR